MVIDKTYIIRLLETNDKAVERALVVLNERQTEDEQKSRLTKHYNLRGFRPCDARMGTSMAEYYSKVGHLTENQIAYWRRRNKKGVMRIAAYWRQLIDAAEQKAASSNHNKAT